MEALGIWVATSLTSPADLSAIEIGMAAAMLVFGVAMLALLSGIDARQAATEESREHYDEAA
jgi:hypothetical protein